MPELAEVTISRELIKPLVENKFITDIVIHSNGRYKNIPPDGYHRLMNIIHSNDIQFTDVSNKGKFLYFTLSNGYYIFNTFGMTGQWSPEQGNHPCISFILKDKDNIISELTFNDPRHFGTIKFIDTKHTLSAKLLELGWDALHDSLEEYIPRINKALNKSKNSIGVELLNQKIFCGIGNYLRAEGLFLAKISPWKMCSTLSKADILLLCRSLKQVVDDAYQHQGATISTYSDPYGNEGKYSGHFKVYNKKHDPFGNIIISEDMSGRTIHWSPEIQK